MKPQETHTIPVTDSDPLVAMTTAVQALESMIAQPDRGPEITLPFQIEAGSLAEALTEMIAIVIDHSTNEHRVVTSIDPGGTLRTDEGIRTWGTVSLGDVVAAGELPQTPTHRIENGRLILDIPVSPQ